ncbi:hypothetical protein Bind_0643 [Beijerinckia indica subsp. indica ATCC 9039]|uniref:Bacteriophage tail tape measure C-terminal domain-containing protein n=1 Tax=Beijerinckia indica subsp. indica (strain ATCC 9039 / DSM 1715 / NCIMB 8712) TaxID=395963 RepID=B2IFT2_BEII9|nr:hypothetical protein Bind_0643 [Beijerinckia indica subsp. indica ATCC 9039]
MASNEIEVRFSADISALRAGIQQASDILKNVGLSSQNATQKASGSLDDLGNTFGNARTYMQSFSQNLVQTRNESVSTSAGIGLIASSSTQLSQALGSVNQNSALAQNAETERYNALMGEADFRRALIREEAQDYQISYQQELAALQSNNVSKLAAIRDHYAALKNAQEEGSSQYLRLSQSDAAAERQIQLQNFRDIQDVNRRLVQEYRSSFDAIGSTVTSSVMSMMQGQRTFSETVRNTLLQIIEMFVQARIRTVAEWLAGTIAQTQVSVVGESAKTSAVSAGTAVRVGLETTASSASMASTFTGVLKSILASATQTFAGIFGFLSPILGPAAIGPAVAGEATVLAAASSLPSFAVGAWSLPSDMIAQVHQGEMIVPAGPAAAMRSALSGGGDQRGVMVQHATNFNVTAIDSQSVSQFFRYNGRQIMRTINDSIRAGTHLGLSRLSSLS